MLKAKSLVNLRNAGAARRLAAAAIYRGTVILGYRSALQRLADVSEDLALTVFHVEQSYLHFIRFGSETARVAALDGILALLKSSAVRADDMRMALQDLVTRRNVLLEDWGGAARHLQEASRSVAASRVIAQARRAAVRADPERLLRVARGVERLVNDVIRKPVLSKADEALLMFLHTVSPTDAAAWTSIYRKLAAFRKARDKFPVDEAEFRRLFRGEASALKGMLLEQWFWKSAPWRLREKKLMREARARARALGPEWQVTILREPLRETRKGLEIYDGAILIVRPTSPDGKTFEAFAHAIVQIKAEKDISVVGQITRDRRRELKGLGAQTLRSSDRAQAFVVRPGTDLHDPIRFIAAPQLPEAARVAGLPQGTDLVYDMSLLDAEQLDELAYLLLSNTIRN
ncbi:MAG TPA: hypothetical protein VMS76_08720 [Planctomycetota bacterium]|nr:hypothetical protein [Planctomycetota bacterium]